MAATTQTVGEAGVQRRVVKTAIEGAAAEGLFGGAAFILALIGLGGILPEVMLPVASIAMGLALLFEGGAVATRYYKLLAGTSEGTVDRADFGMGLTSEFLGGLAGVVLGILSLLNIYPTTLMPVAVIIFGSVLMLGSVTEIRLSALESERFEESSRLRTIGHEAVTASAGAEFLLGLGGTVLGIVALAESIPVTLSLVGIIVVGISVLATGTAVTARMLSLFRS